MEQEKIDRLEFMKKLEAALELDLMLLEQELKQGQMDGIKLEDWSL